MKLFFICNGFQALIKLGLVPYGRILDADEDAPTLTFNTIGRHQSRLVRTRVASDLSPWLSLGVTVICLALVATLALRMLASGYKLRT